MSYTVEMNRNHQLVSIVSTSTYLKNTSTTTFTSNPGNGGGAQKVQVHLTQWILMRLKLLWWWGGNLITTNNYTRTILPQKQNPLWCFCVSKEPEVNIHTLHSSHQCSIPKFNHGSVHVDRIVRNTKLIRTFFASLWPLSWLNNSSPLV